MIFTLLFYLCTLFLPLFTLKFINYQYLMNHFSVFHTKRNFDIFK